MDQDGDSPASRTDRVAAIIVNFNGGSLTAACLDSLARSTHQPERIYLVDNASTDGSLDALRRRPEHQLEFIVNEDNLGFARACNQGMERALEEGFDFVFLLNNDARLEPEALARLLDAAHRHPKAGLLSGKIYLGDGPVLWSAGMDVGFHPNLQRLRGFGVRDCGQFDKEETVAALTGCALLMRTSFLRSVGLFDEEFFVYVEDLELSLRAKDAGWTCLHVPGARFHHDAGSTSGQGYSPWRKYMLAYNLVLFLRKRRSFSLWLAFWLFDVLCWPGVFILAILKGRQKGALAKGRGFLDALLKRKAATISTPGT